MAGMGLLIAAVAANMNEALAMAGSVLVVVGLACFVTWVKLQARHRRMLMTARLRAEIREQVRGERGGRRSTRR